MSLHLPSRQLLRTARAVTALPSPFSLTQRRSAWLWDRWTKSKGNTGKAADIPDHLTKEYLTKKRARPKLVRGDLAESSILEDEEVAGPKPRSAIDGDGVKQKIMRNPATMAAALDPDPTSTRRWERKMVIREIRKRGRLTKAQQLKQQERELVSKSHDWRTSVKKLVYLANQIKGKSIDDAIVQMRFSKKKAAKEVKDHLEHAKNEAILKRNMGMGLPEGTSFTPTTIMTNDKKRVKVTDPTTIYVDQAWCNKGLFGQEIDYRARGQGHMMKNRSTSITVVLKEEKTRIRLQDDREKKLAKRRVWTQLPNRPITAQRQYCLW